MSAAECLHCSQPTAGARLCARCTKTLDVAIANSRAYIADLDTVRTRQSRYSAVAGKTPAGREQPLPVDLRFTDAYPDPRSSAGEGSRLEADARSTIVGWVRIIIDEHPPVRWAGPVCRNCLHRSCNQARLRRAPEDNLISCCHYLQRQLPYIAAAEWAEEILDELLDLERRLCRFVDRPADRWYAGPCTAGLRAMEAAWFCGAELYAVPGRDTVTCRECDWTYPVEERRAWLLAAAEDRLENAATIARAVLVLGQADGTETQLASRIRQWARRRRITVRSTRTIEGKLQPLYRVGDVLDLLAEDARHAVEKAG